MGVKNGPSGGVYSGYFKAPATANYRFYVTADDESQLYISNVTMDPSKKFRIYSSGWYSSWRDWFFSDENRASSWVNLTKDEYYFLEARYI